MSVKVRAEKPAEAKDKNKGTENIAGIGIRITAPNFKFLQLKVENMPNSPLVIHAFSAKAREMMKMRQEQGSTSNSKRNRKPKDFNALYNEARHLAKQGWDGIAAAAFRNAMVSACRTVGVKMTLAKLAFSIEADGVDRDSGMPLVKIYGTPIKFESTVRLETGVADVRIRPRWDKWHAMVRVRYDADMLTAEDVANLLMRAGMQCGICEGRPDSKNSCGQGWGTFSISGTIKKPE